MNAKLLCLARVLLLTLLGCGALPGRLCADIFTVTSATGSGAGTLADAITQANAVAGPHTINFNLGAGGLQTISLSAALPAITQTVTIDGTSQQGFDPLNPKPMIDINGNAADFAGFAVSAANCVFRGLIVRNFGRSSSPTVSADAFHCTGAGGNKFELCWVGVLSNGTTRSSIRGDGIVFENCPNNTVGGPTADKRCVIGGCAFFFLNSVLVGGNGVHCIGAGATGNVLETCYIGLRPDGAGTVNCDQAGVFGDGCGSLAIEQCNITGNNDGVHFKNAGSCTVTGCTLGLSGDGTLNLGNGSMGVRCENTADCTIGGPNPGDACTICGSTQTGIYFNGAGCTNALVQRCFIGTDANGHAGFGNGNGGISVNQCAGAAIRGCTVCANQGLSAGIELGAGCSNATVDQCQVGLNPDGLTPNGNGTASGGSGIELNGATGCTITNSYICGNGKVATPPFINVGVGINLFDSPTTGNVVRGCKIGVNTAGGAVGNARAGVFIQAFGANVIAGNTVGGPNAGDGNEIGFNLGDGVLVSGPDLIQRNSIHDNQFGKDVQRNGDNEGSVTEPRPVLTDAQSDGAQTTGTLTFTGTALFANAPITFDFYTNAAPDANGHDEEQTFVGSVAKTADANGNVGTGFTLPLDLQGRRLNATGWLAAANGEPIEDGDGVVVGTGSGGGGAAVSSANNQWFGIAGDPINTHNAELLALEAVDLSLHGPMPLFFARYYASKLKTDAKVASALGDNRAHNFDWKLALTDATHAEIVTDRGRVVTFTKANNVWVLTSRADIAYQLAPSGSGFVLGDPRDQRMFTFNAAGQLAKIEDGRGNTHTITYNGDGTLATVSDGLGRILTFTYAAGKLTGVGDGTRAVAFAYTGSNLATATDTLNHATTYSYDAAGLMASLTEPEGNLPYAQVFTAGKATSQTARGTDTMTINYAGNTTTTTEPTGATLVDTYAATGEITSFTDEAGRTIAMTSDAKGRRNRVVDRLGDTTTFAFHTPSGLPQTITNAEHHDITMTRTARGLNGLTFFDVTKMTYPDGTGEEFTHDAHGNVTTMTDRAGKKWSFTYNARGQALTATNPTGGVMTFTYDPGGRVASGKDSETGATTYAYDALSRLTKITRPDTKTVLVAYDAGDRITSITDEEGHAFTFAYDTNDRLTGVTDPETHIAQFGYDALDRVTQTTDRLGRVSSVTFDSRQLLASATDRNGNITTFQYDTRRRPTGVVDPGGKTWSRGYDDESLLTSAQNPVDPAAKIVRNHLGRPAFISDPLGHTLTLERDAMQRVTRKLDLLGRATSYRYDARGLLSSSTQDGVGTAAFTRDALGQVSKIVDPIGAAWSFTHSKEGRMQTMRDPLGAAWSYAYDTRGRMNKVTFPDATTETITRDGAGNVTRRQFTDSTDLAFTYDGLNRLLSANGVTFTRDAEGRITNSAQSGADFGATYDDDGRLKTVSYNAGALVVTYAYDTRDRLTSVSDNLNNTIIQFTYDDAGRPIAIQRANGVTTNHTYDPAGRLTRIQHGALVDLHFTLNAAGETTNTDFTAPLLPAVQAGATAFKFNKASEILGADYAYDARGRLLKSTGHTFAWDGASRLKTHDGVTFAYNGLDDIVTRTESGTTTSFFHNYAFGMPSIAADKNETTGFIRYYVRTPGGMLLYSVDSANVYAYYLFDQVGSTLALTNTGGTVTDAYAYSPFGEPLGHTGASAQPFTYVGAWGVRSEGALHQMRARYYDPASARFLSRDPLPPRLRDPQSLNLYAYASENPLRYVDPRGEREGEYPVSYVERPLTLPKFVLESSDSSLAAPASASPCNFEPSAPGELDGPWGETSRAAARGFGNIADPNFAVQFVAQPITAGTASRGWLLDKKIGFRFGAYNGDRRNAENNAHGENEVIQNSGADSTSSGGFAFAFKPFTTSPSITTGSSFVLLPNILQDPGSNAFHLSAFANASVRFQSNYQDSDVTAGFRYQW